MAYPDEVRLAVRSSYIHERLPLAAAAEKHNVPYNTVRGWKKSDRINNDDWDRARSASRMAQGGLGDLTFRVMEDFALLFESTIDDLKKRENRDPIKTAEAISRLADAYTKTVKAAGNSNPKINQLGVALEVIKLLAKYIEDHFPEQTEPFVSILERFAPTINEAFNV